MGLVSSCTAGWMRSVSSSPPRRTAICSGRPAWAGSDSWRLLQKAAPAILGRDLLVRVVAGELDVAAERQKRDAVFGFAPGEAEEARPESDGEPDRLHADGLPHQQVTQLVEENHHADHQRERNQRKS